MDSIQLIRQRGLWHPGNPLRLHLGCGERRLDGYVNVDFPSGEHAILKVRPDLEADLTTLRFPSGSVDEVRLHHVFEHFNRVTALALLIRWHDWLRVQGILRIETPDLEGSARTIVSEAPYEEKMAAVRHLAGDQTQSWGYHVDHWFPERFERTLAALGFGEVHTNASQWQTHPFLANVEARAVKTHNVPSADQLASADRLLWESTVAPTDRPMWEVWRAQLRELLRSGMEVSSSPDEGT